MESQKPLADPVFYEICVDGRISASNTIWFQDMEVTVDDHVTPPQTLIRGPVSDQAALYGLIGRARDLGLTLLFVRRIEEAEL